MLSRSVAFLVWALVAATVVYWGSLFMARPSDAPVPVVALDVGAAAGADLSRLLGAARTPVPTAAATPATSSRFRLTGVVAPQHPGDQGLALISVDGSPPRVYRVGAALDGDLMLREVSLRTATVAPAGNSNDPGASFVLALPPPSAAAPTAATAPAGAGWRALAVPTVPAGGAVGDPDPGLAAR